MFEIFVCSSHESWNLRNKTLKEIPVVFHNGYNYDYHFRMKDAAEKFEGQFECLGKKHREVKNILCAIKKETVFMKGFLINLKTSHLKAK